MNTLAISAISVLSVIFLIIILEHIFRHRFSYIYTVANDDEGTEARLRILLSKNPGAEIIVIDKTQLRGNTEILKKLSSDFPEIHITYM